MRSTVLPLVIFGTVLTSPLASADGAFTRTINTGTAYFLLDTYTGSGGQEIVVSSDGGYGRGNFMGSGFGRNAALGFAGDFWGYRVSDGVLHEPWRTNGTLWDNPKTINGCPGYIVSVVYPWVSWRVKCGDFAYTYTSVINSTLRDHPSINHISFGVLGLKDMLISTLSSRYPSAAVLSYVDKIGVSWAIRDIDRQSGQIVLDLPPFNAISSREIVVLQAAYPTLEAAATGLIQSSAYFTDTALNCDGLDGGTFPACTPNPPF